MEQNVFLILAVAVSIAVSIAGSLLLHAAWQARRHGKPARRRVLVMAAWSLLLVSLVPWSLAGGGDRGVALAIIVLMLAGSALVLRAGFMHRGKRNGRKEKPEREARENTPVIDARRLLLRRTWVFLLAGPVAAVASVFLAAALFASWNVETGSAANRLAAVILAVPVLWTLIAIYATYDVPLRYRSLAVSVCLLAGLAGTFLSKGVA